MTDTERALVERAMRSELATDMQTNYELRCVELEARLAQRDALIESLEVANARLRLRIGRYRT